MSQTILATIFSFIPFNSVMTYVYEKIISYFSSKTINSLCIPYIDETLLQNLSSKNTYIVNLDKEISNTLDSDEQKLESVGELISARIVYNKSIATITELKDIILNSSNAITQFLFVSIDYRLLKYSGTGSKIVYAIPSDAYYKTLKSNTPNWDDALYTKIKNDLIARKGGKLQVYHSLIDLQTLIVNNFNNITIKI